MATYRGTGITVSGWQSSAEEHNAQPDHNDMTAGQDHDVRLEGESGQTEGFGNRAGDQVPNLNVTHVSKPAKTHGLPGNVATNQNALSTGRGSRGRRGR